MDTLRLPAEGLAPLHPSGGIVSKVAREGYRKIKRGARCAPLFQERAKSGYRPLGWTSYAG